MSTLVDFFKALVSLAWAGLLAFLLLHSGMVDALIGAIRNVREVDYQGPGGRFKYIGRQTEQPQSSSAIPGVKLSPNQGIYTEISDQNLIDAVVGTVQPVADSGGGDRRHLFSYQINPLPTVSGATFYFDHPSMPKRFREGISVVPGEKVAYEGWGCLEVIKVTVSFEGGKPPRTVNVNGCKKVGWQ